MSEADIYDEYGPTLNDAATEWGALSETTDSDGGFSDATDVGAGLLADAPQLRIPFTGVDAARILVHKLSGIAQVIRDEKFLSCGRPVSSSYVL